MSSMGVHPQILDFAEGPHRMRKKLKTHYDFSKVYRKREEAIDLKKMKEEEEEEITSGNIYINKGMGFSTDFCGAF